MNSNRFDSTQLTNILLQIFFVERFYGALTGLNKTATAEQLGEDLVQGWRGSLRSRPPPLDEQSQVSGFPVFMKKLQSMDSAH